MNKRSPEVQKSYLVNTDKTRILHPKRDAGIPDSLTLKGADGVTKCFEHRVVYVREKPTPQTKSRL